MKSRFLNSFIIICLVCDGGPDKYECCSLTHQCGEGGGDCDSDSDCGLGLVCGHDNCQEFHPSADAQADCCVKKEECKNREINDDESEVIFSLIILIMSTKQKVSISH